MAMDLKGLFANPAAMRQQRLEGLQQQRRQIGQMGGSMAGLLGQVAAGGTLLGEQLAEGIAGGLGLKTQQEAQAEAQQQAVQGMKMGNLTSMKAARDRLAALDNVSPAALAALDDRIMQAEDRALQRQANSEARQRAIAAEQRAAATFRMQKEQFDRAAGDKAAQREAIGNMLPDIDDAYMSPQMKELVMTLEPSQAIGFIQSANKAAKDAVKLAAFNSASSAVLDQIKPTGDAKQRPTISQLNAAYLPLIEQARNANLPGKVESLTAELKARVDNEGDLRGIENSLKAKWESNKLASVQKQAVLEGKKTLNLLEAASTATDLSAVYAFMSSLDPSSIVRGEEVEMVAGLGGLAANVMAKINQLGDGELTPELRKEIADAIVVITTTASDAYNLEHAQQSQSYASQGYNTDYILGPKMSPPSIQGMTFGSKPGPDTQLSDAEAGVGFL